LEPELTHTASPHLAWDASHTAEALLSLAVQPALSSAPELCSAGLVLRADEILRAYATNTLAQAALSSLTGGAFQSDACVACLEGDPPPDALFLPCGHCCMHWEEAAMVESCPLCRRLITARICRSNGAFVARPTRPQRTPIFRQSQHFNGAPPGAFKPVIYLYPDEATLDVDVRVSLAPSQNCFTALVPAPCEGGLASRSVVWRVSAEKDGTLRSRGREPAASHPPVASLFWESEEMPAGVRGAGTLAALLPRDGRSCFCVSGARLGDWLLRALPAMGLTVREYTEMASFWAAKLGHHAFVVLRFLPPEEINAAAATLVISPPPRTVIRVFLLAQGAQVAPPDASAVDALPDCALAPRRLGFTAVEWGGAEVQAVESGVATPGRHW